MENIMTTHTSTRLTDALERDLLAKAMESQFRFHPLRAIKNFVFSIASFINAVRTQTNARYMF
jgi:predicted transcriptional regulator